MRFYLFGPRFLGIRTGISFQPSDLRSHKPPKSSSYVYVIKGDENNVKIGVTKNPEGRLAQLRTGNHATIDYAYLAPTSGDPYAIERAAHTILDRYRLNGEWFDVPPELAIAAVTGAAAKLGQSLTAKPDEKPSMIGLFRFIFWLILTSLWIYFLISWFNSLPPAPS
jgi:T5orf172 domain